MFTRLLSRYWLLLPLLILVVIAVDRIETPPVVEIEETIDMRQTQSDYYMGDFKTRKFRADGTVEYTIEGETLAHYPDNDRSEIIAPVKTSEWFVPGVRLLNVEGTWRTFKNRMNRIMR